MDGLTLSIGVVVCVGGLYAFRTVIRKMKGRRAVVDETPLDALPRIDQAR